MRLRGGMRGCEEGARWKRSKERKWRWSGRAEGRRNGALRKERERTELRGREQ